MWAYMENKTILRFPRSDQELTGVRVFRQKLGPLVERVREVFPMLEDPEVAVRERRRQEREEKNSRTEPERLSPVTRVPTVTTSNGWKPTPAAEALLRNAK
jgi:hypothetical protein